MFHSNPGLPAHHSSGFRAWLCDVTSHNWQVFAMPGCCYKVAHNHSLDMGSRPVLTSIQANRWLPWFIKTDHKKKVQQWCSSGYQLVRNWLAGVVDKPRVCTCVLSLWPVWEITLVAKLTKRIRTIRPTCVCQTPMQRPHLWLTLGMDYKGAFDSVYSYVLAVQMVPAMDCTQQDKKTGCHQIIQDFVQRF